ncbi:hypothetical protein C1645_338076 [Glomus cerebriforme]|uniref:UBA domain-containing protein n=1 Tax=Glomus cerebriforme TaxID=658196 RepID=A0A397TG98_9GLOM|nr:hypothetical protein C1645_338076 [Glomus cerebriforme]
MGFIDNSRNREVLNTTNGDLSAAIEILCRLPIGSTQSTSTRSSTIPNISSDDKLTQLWNMGFQDEAKNRDALRRTGGNVEVAAALLVEARNSESLKNNNNANSSKSNPSVNPQTEQQRIQIKLPISQSSNQSLSDSSSLQPISFQQSQTTTQNSAQNNLGTFGSLSLGTGLLNFTFFPFICFRKFY